MEKKAQLPKRGEVLTKYVAELTPKEIIKLLKIVNQIFATNQAVPSRTAKWLGKNQKNLLDAYEKLAFEETEIREPFSEYMNLVEKHTNGKDIFWDGVEDEATGVKGYLNEKGELVNISNDKVLQGDVLKKMVPYVKDATNRATYEAKTKEFNEAIEKHNAQKVEVALTRISSVYTEQTRLGIPTVLPTQAGHERLALDLYEQYLVTDNDDEPADNAN